MKSIILFIPLLISDLLYLLSSDEIKDLVDADTINCLKVQNKRCGSNKIQNLNLALQSLRSFRTVYAFRLGGWKSIVIRFLLGTSKTIEIRKDSLIAGGLHIPHLVATVNAYYIGRNCFVGQGAVIGIGNDIHGDGIGAPRIGDNCYIGANAVVFGGCIIGDNVSIGAGAVVNKDVPSNSIVIGCPMQIKGKKIT